MSLSILVADDHDGIRKTLCRLLKAEGYQVVEAMDGSEAITEIRKTNFALVLTNIKMPQADGYEVLRFAMGVDPELPVVLISGYGDAMTKKEAIAKGARDFIFKPASFDDLLEKIKALARRN